MWSLKRNNTKELTYKTERDSQTEGTNLMVVRGQGGGKDAVEGIIREFGMDTYTLLYLKWITDKGLPRSTGNSARVIGQPGWEGSLEKNQFSSAAQSCLTLWDPTDCSTPDFPLKSLLQHHMEKNGYVYIYGWVLWLFTWSYHNIVNWLIG